MFENVEKIIGPYTKLIAKYDPYDRRAPEVAECLRNKIESYLPEITIEHIGSTAIPDCPGKGVTDTDKYAEMKRSIVQQILGDDYGEDS